VFILKKNLALAAIALVFLLGAAQAQSPNSVPGQLKEIQAQLSNLEAQNASLAAQVASNRPRNFYLTKAQTHNGATALSACDTGYHMASLWEIHDPTNLRYDTGRGLTADDSGFGPPSFIFGWIRSAASTTAFISSSSCKIWTSAGEGQLGILAALDYYHIASQPVAPATGISPWTTAFAFCDNSRPVWCVQD